MSTKDCRLNFSEKAKLSQYNRRGVSLNVLLIGEKGIGKKSFINSIAGKQYFNTEEDPDYEERPDVLEDTELKLEKHEIVTREPNGIPIKLNVFLTKNFGLSIDNSNNAAKLLSYLENELDITFNEERKIRRNPKFEDNRIHVGLYFMRGTGKVMKDLDIDVMKKLSKRVNLIPILAKADTLTVEEVLLNKRLILKSLEEHNVEVFNFLEDYDEDDYRYVNDLQEHIPFSVISSNSKHERCTLWGNIDIANTAVCDFLILQKVLLLTHIHEFKEVTETKKYESYRVEKLLAMSS